MTRLERPAEYAGQAFLAEEDVATLERAAAERQFAPRPVDPKTGTPLTQDGVGDYNPEWFDSGITILPSRRTSLIVDPPDGRIPYTQEALRHQRRYGTGPYDSYLDLDTGERCLGDGALEMIWLGYNPNHQIVQTTDHVVILHEMFHERRIIPLDGGPHVDAGIRQWNGNLRGRWEGDTLVVESTNFVDRWRDYRFNAVWRAPSQTLHLVERFTRLDAETMVYRVTITDPARFTSPWIVETYLTTNQAARGVTTGPMYEYACHEGNYGGQNILTGISILPAGSGPSYTNTPLRTPDFFSARYSAPNSRQVGPRSTGNRLEPLLSGYFSGTAPHVCPVFAASLHSGRASASWHRQRPDPPQHVAEQPPGQMPLCQQEPVVPRMLHQPAPGFH